MDLLQGQKYSIRLFTKQFANKVLKNTPATEEDIRKKLSAYYLDGDENKIVNCLEIDYNLVIT
jgi:hypothetical protein